jgi:hypothetical protein
MMQRRERKQTFAEGGQFEDIQDSWPEEIASVEALAVEPYLELE